MLICCFTVNMYCQLMLFKLVVVHAFFANAPISTQVPKYNISQNKAGNQVNIRFTILWWLYLLNYKQVVHNKYEHSMFVCLVVQPCLLLLLLHICCSLLFVWIKLIRLISTSVRLMFLRCWHTSINALAFLQTTEGWDAH